MSEPILKVENLNITFTQYVSGLKRRDLHVIQGLDIDLHQGEIMAIVGSSGSGKSLLANSILGILPENATVTGSMTYQGEELTQQKKEGLRGKEICLIPQSVNYLDPLMKVGKQVQLSIKDKAQAKREQRRVFAEYGLGEEVDNMYPFQLSGGMTRRVMVSTAVLSGAKVIIADEPTPGLDEKALHETLHFFTELRDQGASIILITHDILAALHIADRIAIFYAGSTLEVANREDFAGQGENLRHPYTQALWNALPENGFSPIPGSQPSPLQLPVGCLFHERCHHCDESCVSARPESEIMDGGLVRCHKATIIHEHVHSHGGVTHSHRHAHVEGEEAHSHETDNTGA